MVRDNDRNRIGLSVAVTAALFLAASTSAEDAYFVELVRDLQLTSGELPSSFPRLAGSYRFRNRAQAMRPYVQVDGGGEACLAWTEPSRRRTTGAQAEPQLAIRLAAGKEVRGTLYWPLSDASGMAAIGFTVPADEGSKDQKNEYLKVKRRHYQRLLAGDIPGAAWFRYQKRDASSLLGQTQSTPATGTNRRFFGRRRGNNLDDTFALVSGGRAVSENLQLDRVLPRSKPAEETVSIDSIRGITVREFDWTKLIQQASPDTDPLAKSIPDDQYALFFPSFQAVVEMIDHAKKHGTPLLRWGDPRSEEALVQDRYQQQLCLPLGALERLVGPNLIRSVAITGGDPYFRTGTDVAVLFEATNVEALKTAIEARQKLSVAARQDAKSEQGSANGIRYSGVRTPYRTICSYVATLDDSTVVVTNSPAQLEKLAQLRLGKSSSLGSLDEYTFFRNRYLRESDSETALLIVSDKTIRRWCGPRWRIATSRRTRAAAVMSELQARNANDIIAGQDSKSPLKSGHWIPDAGEFSLTSIGVHSPVYGSLAFQTPIAELDVNYATQEESRLYARWRDGYQRYWSNFFDPIAVQFVVEDKRLAVDMTVMPLIDRSDYQPFIEISKGGKIQSSDGDPHTGTLFHAAVAINVDSARIKQYSALASAFAPQLRVNPISWLGNVVSLYADQDPFWEQLSKADWEDPAKRTEHLRESIDQLPLVLHIGVRSGLKLTAFLVGLRAFIEQTAPGMTVWENREHEGQAYVRIGPSPQAVSRNDDWEKLGVFYATSGEAWVLSLSEKALHRAMHRMKSTSSPNDEAAAIKTPNWLGDNVCVQADRQLTKMLDIVFHQNYLYAMQARCWNNLPILNEWKRIYPDRNPLDVHQTLWQRKLVCPGGGDYVWNEEWNTMKSTLYGHPGAPQSGPTLPEELKSVSTGNFGLTFEENGLRARFELLRE